MKEASYRIAEVAKTWPSLPAVKTTTLAITTHRSEGQLIIIFVHSKICINYCLNDLLKKLVSERNGDDPRNPYTSTGIRLTTAVPHTRLRRILPKPFPSRILRNKKFSFITTFLAKINYHTK